MRAILIYAALRVVLCEEGNAFIQAASEPSESAMMQIAVDSKGQVDDEPFPFDFSPPTTTNPKWFAPTKHVDAHGRWYQDFVWELLQRPIVCEFADGFNMGVKAVDSQHAKLFHLFEQLRQVLVEKKANERQLVGAELQTLKTVLAWLKQYCVVHFDAEEKLQEESGFPDRVVHTALHRGFFGQVRMMDELVGIMIQEGKGFNVLPVYAMLAKWLQDHICVMDKKELGSWVGNASSDLTGFNADGPDGISDGVLPLELVTAGGASLLEITTGGDEWAPAKHVLAHEHWYRAFVWELLRRPIVCGFADGFNIQVAAVDSQHAKLFLLVDKVRQVMVKGAVNKQQLAGAQLGTLKTVLAWLMQYCVVHFDAEEKLMEETGFPDMVGHVAKHRAFFGHVRMMDQLVGIMIKQGKGFYVSPIYAMLAKWLQDHICVLDKKDLGSWVKNNAGDVDVNSNKPDGIVDNLESPPPV
jgi:hemerythrin